jgi:hypothetical protein
MIANNRISLLKEANKVATQYKPKKQEILVRPNSKTKHNDIKQIPENKENNNQYNMRPAKIKSPTSLKKSPSDSSIHTAHMTDIELQNINSFEEYGNSILSYLIEYENKFPTDNCLSKHEITPNLRSKMVDWMIEVLTNFKCRDLTLYLAVKIMDRFLKISPTKQVSDLHIVGVTSMFMASKYEDIYPLRMQMVYEKIAHKKVSVEAIKNMEKEVMTALGSSLGIPTTFEFLRLYFRYIKVVEYKQFIEQMSFYLAKACLHDYEFCKFKVSLIAAACIYVAFKICEQLNKVSMIDHELVNTLCELSSVTETILMECSQKVLNDAQNFEKQFPGLENLKKTHFVNLANFLNK